MIRKEFNAIRQFLIKVVVYASNLQHPQSTLHIAFNRLINRIEPFKINGGEKIIWRSQWSRNARALEWHSYAWNKSIIFVQLTIRVLQRDSKPNRIVQPKSVDELLRCPPGNLWAHWSRSCARMTNVDAIRFVEWKSTFNLLAQTQAVRCCRFNVIKWNVSISFYLFLVVLLFLCWSDVRFGGLPGKIASVRPLRRNVFGLFGLLVCIVLTSMPDGNFFCLFGRFK